MLIKVTNNCTYISQPHRCEAGCKVWCIWFQYLWKYYLETELHNLTSVIMKIRSRLPTSIYPGPPVSKAGVKEPPQWWHVSVMALHINNITISRFWTCKSNTGYILGKLERKLNWNMKIRGLTAAHISNYSQWQYFRVVNSITDIIFEHYCKAIIKTSKTAQSPRLHVKTHYMNIFTQYGWLCYMHQIITPVVFQDGAIYTLLLSTSQFLCTLWKIILNYLPWSFVYKLSGVSAKCKRLFV